MRKQASEPTCLCGGVGSMMRITDKAMVKRTLCKGTGVRIVETGGGVMATVDEIMESVEQFGIDYCSCKGCQEMIVGPKRDAIRSMLASVAPDPALREAIAEAVRTCDLPVGGGFDATGHLTDRDCDALAASVLAVLAERGIG